MPSQEQTTTMNDEPEQTGVRDLALVSTESTLSVTTPMPRSIFTLSTEHLDRMKLLSDMVAKSQLAVNKNGSNKMSQGDIFLVMLKGIELGIEPMAALDSIDLISGKPTLDPQGMLALIHKSGQLDDIKIDSTDARCTVTMQRKNKTPHTETFGVEEATRYMTSQWVDGVKQTIPLIQKDNYKSQPKVMFKWRAVSACARVVFPDIIQGLYTPEELGADVLVDDAGKMIVITPVPQQPKSTSRPAAQPATTPAPSSSQEPEAEQPSQPTDPTTPQTWADEAKINWILDYAPKKLDGITATDISRYTGIENLKDYAAWNAKYLTSTEAMKAIKDAYDADTAAAADAPPAQPKTSRFDKSSHKWTEAEVVEMDSAAGRFWNAEKAEPLSAKDALTLLGKLFWNEFGDPKVALAALRTLCIEKVLPIIAHNATYKKGTDKKILYSELSNDILAVRRVGLREYLGKELGEEWATYVETWEAKETYTFADDEMPNLIVTWTLNDGVPTLSKVSVLELAF